MTRGPGIGRAVPRSHLDRRADRYLLRGVLGSALVVLSAAAFVSAMSVVGLVGKTVVQLRRTQAWREAM